MARHEPISSPRHERRAGADRREDTPRSLYDRLDETFRKIEADRRRARRRRSDGNGTARRMSLDEALQVAADVAKAESPQLVVAGLTGTEGSSRYVEMPIALKGCHVEPCCLSIGFDRTISPAQLREVMRRRIREHLRERPH